jgi:hypothetical protein
MVQKHTNAKYHIVEYYRVFLLYKKLILSNKKLKENYSDLVDQITTLASRCCNLSVKNRHTLELLDFDIIDL